MFEGLCPYRGLEVFDVKHAPFFFGRGALTEWLLDELKQRPGQPPNRFLAIIGASGSGKSSLARAGLVAALRQGKLTGSGDWPTIILKPGSDPLETLALKLADTAAGVKAVRDELLSNPAQIHLETRFRLQDQPEDRRLLLLVDQFEEVYTLCRDADVRRAFIDNLLHAANQPLGQTVVVLTMRADFYGRCAEHDGLAAAIADHQLLVGAMNEGELREAIEQPAYATGCELEPGLSDLLVRDVSSNAGALPLMQFALQRLWERRHGNRLTVAEYQQIGGLQGALKQRADEIYQGFDAAQQEACRRIFLRLTEPGEGTEDTRRRAWLSELGSGDDTREVLEQLTQGRLVTTDDGEAGAEGIIEVTHEALIRGWPLLQGWIEADREAVRIQHRLSQATKEWLRHERDPSYLYQGGRLAQAEDWAGTRRDTLSDDEGSFLDAGIEQREAEARRLEEQRQRELKKSRELAAEKTRSASRLRLVIGVVMLALVTTLGIAGYAYLKKLDADEATVVASEAEKKATKQAKHAQKELLRANFNLAKGYEHEAMNALEDVLAAPGPLKATRKNREAWLFATAALSQELAPGKRALAAAKATRLAGVGGLRVPTRERWQRGDSPDRASAVAFSPDGSRLASAGFDGTVRQWDAATGEPIGEALTGHQGRVWSVAFSPDGSRLASAGNDGVRQWNAATGESLDEAVTGHQDPVLSVAYSPDGSRLASAGTDGTIRQWNAATGEPLGGAFTGHQGLVWSVAFSPDGSRLASAGDDGTVRQWDVATGESLGEALNGHGGSVLSVAFSPDGSRLASAGNDGVRQWNAATGEPLGEVLTGHQDSVLSVAFNPDGLRLASAGFDGTVRQWDAVTGDPIGEALTGHEAPVSSVAFSPGGSRLASAGWDGTIRQWDAATGDSLGEAVTGDQGGVMSVAFSPDGSRLASASEGGTVRQWDAATGQPIGEALTGHYGSVRSVAYSPDGARLASAGEGGAVRQWDVVTGEPLGEALFGNEGWVLSIAFSPDGSRLASAGEDGTVRQWDVATDEPIGEALTGHDGSVMSVAFSPDGSRLASAGTDGTVRQWDAVTGDPIGEALTGRQSSVWSLAFSPDGARLASAGEYGTVRQWDAVTGEPIGEALTGHDGSVSSIAFSPDGTRLASAGSDGTVRQWDSMTGDPLGEVLTGGQGQVFSIAYSPDGSRLASAGLVGPVRQWKLPDARIQVLLMSTGEYRLLAAELNDALSFLWELKLDGLTIKPNPHPPRMLPDKDGYWFDYEPKYATLLQPPRPDETRFDQVLRWAEQQSGITLQRCTDAVLKLDTDGTNPACITRRP